MRRSLAILILLTACGGGTDTSTGPKPVASVSVQASLSSLTVGQTTTLTATATDASGAALTGRTVTWTSSAPTVATVSGGLVTAVSAGSATITATVEAKSGQQVITVLPAVTPGCVTGTPLSVAVGEIHPLTTAERQQLCIAGGAAGSEYVLIPFNSATAGTNVAVQLAASNTSTTLNPPLSASISSGAQLSGFTPTPAASRPSGRFDMQLRQLEHGELAPRMRAARRAIAAQPSFRNPGFSAIKGLAATPTVGTPIRLNANANDACSNPTMRGGSVRAVSNKAIVVVDSTTPAGGFTDADYQAMAVTFDTLIFPLDTAAYGAPFDMDANGRVILFFTTAVNQLTPANSTTGYIGGFFHPRDLFSTVINAVFTTQASLCATSNEGEMFYLPVFDPNQVYNRFFNDKTRLQKQVIATLAHEFQHLINASRRIYVTVADVDFEETWLNEGMSHIAEELLYYRASGFAPKGDLTIQTVTATQARLDIINAYQVDNLGRLTDYLLATDVNSPYAPNDLLETRGATWELLRYAMDLMPGANSTYLKGLVDAPTQGVANFNLQFGGVFGSLTGAVRQQVITQFFDNTVVAIDSKYAFPSWNYRSILPNLNNGAFPLTPKNLTPASNATFSVTPGGAGYARFRVNAGVTGGIIATSSGGGVPTAVELILIRTQ